MEIWRTLSDPAMLKLQLERLFGEITVTPLRGAWANGWTLNLNARPWALIPKGGEVAFSVGCGARI